MDYFEVLLSSAMVAFKFKRSLQSYHNGHSFHAPACTLHRASFKHFVYNVYFVYAYFVYSHCTLFYFHVRAVSRF